MSNLHMPPNEWLAELFEFEYCADCGGDACVLLSRGTTTLAAKSTNDDRVVYHRAYYSM